MAGDYRRMAAYEDLRLSQSAKKVAKSPRNIEKWLSAKENLAAGVAYAVCSLPCNLAVVNGKESMHASVHERARNPSLL
jgi:hypothetical protein